jgi:hypothetical protein
MAERALEAECLSLCGSSVKGTWREGSFAGDPEGYVQGVQIKSGPYFNISNLFKTCYITHLT